MKKWIALLAMAAVGLPAFAELQSVEVGGELKIRIRGNMNYQNDFGSPARTLIPSPWVSGRPIGATGLGSRFSFDDDSTDRFYGEMQTRLHVTARFTDEVLTFVELES